MVSQLDALLTHLGTGKWSVLHFITMSYYAFFLAPQALGGAFLAPRLDYSCRVPINYLNLNSTADFFLDLQANTSYVTPRDECHYKLDTPKGEVLEDCVQFDFDNSTFTSTITSEYNLACGRAYLQTSFQSMYMLGSFVGSPIIGYLSDKYGRKPMVKLGYMAYMVLGVASAWLPHLSTILVARFLLGFLHFINSYITFVLLLEVIEPKLRTAAGFLESNFWAVGMMLYGGFGYWIRDWRTLQTVMMLPGLLLLPVLWMIDESPRWLIVNGRHKEALNVFDKVARWHGVELPPEAEMEKVVEMQTSECLEINQSSSIRLLFKSVTKDIFVLLRTPRLRSITLFIYLDFLVVGMVYYGLSLSGASISDDPYLYMVLSGLMEIPAYTLIVPVVQRFGTKFTLCFLFITCAGVLLAPAIIPTEYSTTIFVLAMVGKMAITAGYQAVSFYASEVFPTEVRSRGIATSSMFSRIGSIVSPFITDMMVTIYPWAPFVVFGSGALLSGMVTLLLPETRGQSLPETVAELEAKARQTSNRKDSRDSPCSATGV